MTRPGKVGQEDILSSYDRFLLERQLANHQKFVETHLSMEHNSVFHDGARDYHAGVFTNYLIPVPCLGL